MNLKVSSTLPWLAALVIAVQSYGYKFSRRPGAADCKLQLNLPGYPPSYHEDYTHNRYSNQFTQAERNKQQQQNSFQQQQQGGYNPGEMIECRRGEVYSLILKKCVRNAQGAGGNYGSLGSSSSSSGNYGGSSGQGNYGGFSGASGSYVGSSGQSGSYGGSSGEETGSYGGSTGQSGSYGSSGVQGGSYGGSSGGSGNYGGSSGAQSGSYGGSKQTGSYGGSSGGSGNYGGSSGGSGGNFGSSGVQSGSYGGSSGVQSGSYGGSKQSGSFGGSSGQSGSYGGSSGGSGNYGGPSGQSGSYGSSGVQSGSYGGSKQTGSYGGSSGSSYGSQSSASSGVNRPTGLINSGNKGFASTNIVAASFRPTDDPRYGAGSGEQQNNRYPSDDNSNGNAYGGSSFEEQSYGSSTGGVVAPTFEEDRYAGSTGGANYEEETSYGGRPSASSSANVGGGVYEEPSFAPADRDNYPTYGTGGGSSSSSFNTDNRRKYGSSSSNLGASSFTDNFGSSASSGPGGVTAIVSTNLRPQGDRDRPIGGGSYSGGGSRVTSQSSFESTDDDDYSNNRRVNSRPINVGPSYTTGGGGEGAGGSYTTSEKKKYSFASSSASQKEEEESTFIASGPPLETESGDFSSSSSVSSTPAQSYDLKFASDALEAHNRYRELHGAVPLVLDPKLSEAAQLVAQRFASGEETFRHTDEAIAGRVGENIAVRTGLSAKAAASAIDYWYKENVNYDFDNPRLVTRPENLSNHRFTALVWNSSRKLGIGKAVGKDGRTYIVAQYFPTGNIVNRLEQNVFPPKSGSSGRASY